MENLLEVDSLATDIGQFHILTGVSFTVPEQQITVLLGRNGAGKTTTLRTMMGYLPPRSGQVRLRGESLQSVPTWQIVRKGVGYVPEDANIFANLSVAENLSLSLPGRHHRNSSNLALTQVQEQFPDLREHWQKPAGVLSGGQRQMLAIACVLVGGPAVMLIDEPSKGLSPLFVERLGDVLLTLQGSTTILLVEQNFYLASRVGQQYVLMDDGKTVAAGPMHELLAALDLQQRYLGIRILSEEMNIP